MYAREMMLVRKIKRRLSWHWPRFWMRVSGIPYCRRIATSIALLGARPCFQRCSLAELTPRGFISTRVTLYGDRINLGLNVFIDDQVLIYQESDSGIVEIGDRVHLFEDTHIHVGPEGSVQIGAGTSSHRGCQIESYKAPIRIGRDVGIAARCTFLSFDHGIAPDQWYAQQPLTTKGPIVIEDKVWLGHGVTVLSGVRIGEGAVVGPGSVVTRDVPAGAIAVGAPACVVRMRSDSMCNDKAPAEVVQKKGNPDYGRM